VISHQNHDDSEKKQRDCNQQPVHLTAIRAKSPKSLRTRSFWRGVILVSGRGVIGPLGGNCRSMSDKVLDAKS
jgi:hypothetical protein